MTKMVEYNRSELIKLWSNSDEDLPFLLFYGGHNNSGIGPHVFSQWFGSLFTDELGLTYNCAEQYMMASKARLFKDQKAHKNIMSEPRPNKQKALGRKITNFDKRIWYREARRIVLKGSWLKFTSNPKLESYLLSTKGSILVEASPSDTIWGIGKSVSNDDCYDPVRWDGLNWLGFSIMFARHCIISKLAPVPELSTKAQQHYEDGCDSCKEGV